MKLTDLHVKVTASAEAKGVPEDPGHCGIAVAMQEQYPHLTNIDVTWEQIRASIPELNIRCAWATPLPARRHIKAFDRGQRDAFKGYTFTLLAQDAEIAPMRRKSPAELAAARKRYAEQLPAKRVERTEQMKRAARARKRARRRNYRKAA